MKKAFLFLILFFLLFLKQPAYAQNSIGTDCGVAGAGGGLEKCCDTTPKALPAVPGGSIIGVLPFFGDFVKNYQAQSDALVEQQKKQLLACLNGTPSTSDVTDPSCVCQESKDAAPIPALRLMCEKYIQDSNERTACEACTDGGGYWSGLTCIPLTAQNFVNNFLLSFGISLAGLVAFLCIIYSAFILQTSRGNPDRIKKAREYLTSCLIGLGLIIFSVLILRLIGVKLIGIPFLS